MDRKTARKSVIILGAGPQQLPAIARAHRLGYAVISPDRDVAAPGLGMCDFPLPGVSTHDPEAIVREATLLRRDGRSVDGVLAMAVEAAGSAARICSELGLPGVSVASADLATDKLSRLKAWRDAGVSCPRFGEAANLEEAVTVAGEIGLPVVLKPLARAGALGVVRCDTAAEVREAYAIAARESEALVLVEEFIEGTEHSSESLVVDGVVHTLGFSDRNYDTKYKYPPHLLENGDTCPTALPASVYSSVLAEVERAIRALGIEFGPAKGDILVRADGRVFMLEMAARLSGDYFCSHTAPLSNGTDIISAALQQAVGVSVDPAYLTWRYDRGVALRYFWPEPLPAVVTAIEGMDECRGLPGVEFITFEPLWADKGIGVGTLLTRPTRHAERVGCVMARGETREEALTLAEYVVDTVRITVDPQGSLSTEEAQ